MKRNSLLRVRQSKQPYRRLDELCEFAPSDAEPGELVFWFVQLVRWLRGAGNEKKGLRLRYLRTQLEQHPPWHDNVSRCLTELVNSWDFEQLLAYGGIARDFHFVGAVREWLAFRGLPIACNTSDAASVLSLSFEDADSAWLADTELGPLALSLIDASARPELQRALEDALVDLGVQLVAQAHSPSVRNLTRVERSPFRGLNQAVEELLAQSPNERAPERLHGRIKQCLLLIGTHKRELVGRGADLNTTFQLDRMSQQLKRAQLLVSVLCSSQPQQLGSACISVVMAVTRNTSGRRLLSRSSDLLLQNLIETAASVGRGYLDDEHSSWRAAFSMGAGGGALMAVATLIKFELASWHLPTFYEGIVFSLNYATIFCTAYLLHFTIATKLPAHTAAALAKSVQEKTGHWPRVRSFLGIWRAMVRLQVAGLLGNVLVAAPFAYLLDVAFYQLRGHHILDAHAVQHVLEANSVWGPSALYAALTGVLLWLSSLVGAAADNWTRVTGMVERLASNLHVMRSVGQRRARPVAQWLVERFGGLTGNAALGFMLGGIPASAAIASLPIDIRHVTVSASSFALAYASGRGQPAQLWLAAVGVIAIGAINVSVSFALALQVALGSRTGKAHGSARALVKVAIGRWLRREALPAERGARAEASQPTPNVVAKQY
jgi:site-specific recombinase